MSELLFDFREGPYEILDYTFTAEDGKIVIEINGGDLGRLPVENMETVEKLREALDHVEVYMTELERRQEEL